LQFVYALKVGDAVIKAKPCQAKQLFQRFSIFPAGFAWGFLGGGGVFFCEKKCHRGKVSRLRPSLTWQCNSSLLPRHANDDGSAGLRMQSRKSEAKAGCKIGGKSEENRGKRDGYRWVVGGGCGWNAECVCKYLLNVFMCKQLRVHLCDFRVANNNDDVDEDDAAADDCW